MKWKWIDLIDNFSVYVKWEPCVALLESKHTVGSMLQKLMTLAKLYKIIILVLLSSKKRIIPSKAIYTMHLHI